ncbi:MAG TPA: PVC-type heme-binding CxxCH protein [Humisphaera sp.]|jgi:putative membrane-bound dehydrogenase-like protein|nr:PVC-type heme-binding CxxCH protein [Humisphaera sp.]
MNLRSISIIAFTIISCRALLAAEPPVFDKDLPRIAPTEAAKAPASIVVHRGLKLELVANEPLVSSPVGISFDEDGRLFVVEMLGYPDLREEHPGRIKLLEDTRGDGHYDKATVYADNLPWPTSALAYDGGVFVTASPDLLYFKDTKHDGVADVRKTILTGFGVTTVPLNVQGLVNGLTWSMDGRIFGTTSENGGMVVRPDAQDKPLNLRTRDFSFDPRAADLDLRVENGGGQHGLSFDPFGRRFACFNNKPLETYMYEARYAGRNPLYAMPPALVEINADGMDAFRISPDEAWRVMRTQWRMAGEVKGPVEGGGRASGYFTSSSGVTIYTGDALPPEFSGNAFIAEPAGNLVHREVLSPQGVGVVGHRAADEKNIEFIASRDVWFRPVQLANGPDGALYIVDMYREVIEHPWSLPDSIKSHLDLHSGVERGRIWRVVPEGFIRRPTPKLSRATTGELVRLLEHPNGWHRDTAARLLFERRDPQAIGELHRLLIASASPVGRANALRVLGSLNAVNESDLLKGLDDAGRHVRAQAIILCERSLRDDSISVRLWTRLRELANDAEPIVRYQLALSLGESHRPQVVPTLATIAQHDLSDKWISAAILSSISGGESRLFSLVWNQPAIMESASGQDFLRQLAGLVGAGHEATQIGAVARAIEARRANGADAFTFSLGRALREGEARGAKGAPPIRTFDGLMVLARATAIDGGMPEPTRVEAIRFLGTSDFASSGSVLLGLLSATSPQLIQSAALSALDHFADPQIGPELVRRLAALSPRLRSEAIAVLLKRPDRAAALLHGIESKTIRPGDLSTAQTRFLRTHADANVRELAGTALAAPPPGRAAAVQAFMPALQLQGSADRGRLVYQQRCVSCHRLEGQGFAVGPDLVTVRSAGKEKTLINILDPNREVAANYIAYVAETTGGDSIVGIISAETSNSLTIRQAFGKENTILRSDLKRLDSQKLSLMPEGLEEGLRPQDVADLLEFVMNAKEPGH